MAAREAWESGAGSAAGRFGGSRGMSARWPRIPAPALPGVRLKPRGNREQLRGFAGAEAPAMS